MVSYLNIFRYRHAISFMIHTVITEQLVIIERNDKENVYFLYVHLVFMYFPFPTLFLDVCMCHASLCTQKFALIILHCSIYLILFYFFKVFSKTHSLIKWFAFLKARTFQSSEWIVCFTFLPNYLTICTTYFYCCYWRQCAFSWQRTSRCIDKKSYYVMCNVISKSFYHINIIQKSFESSQGHPKIVWRLIQNHLKIISMFEIVLQIIL